jgi:RNA polymerase sigma-70 factor (ECF subfamily)
MWRVARQDDETAFTSLMRRWHPPILRLCTRMIGDPHRAEDLAQETFSRVFTQRKKFQPERKFSTWLWRIALNLCYDELRAPRRREEPWLGSEDETGDSTFVSSGLSPEGHAVRVEEDRLVQQALAALPETYRSVLVLRHYQDLKFREIAEILGIPEGTVKSRMVEALHQLSRRLHAALEMTPSDRISLANRPDPATRPNQKAIL